MDPVTLVYYGAVCGLLSAAAPRLPAPARLAVGVLVGLVAAGILPVLRGALGL